MKQSKEMWKALHAVILDELTFRGGGSQHPSDDQQLDALADHLTDVVIANFELAPRQR
jgi:hypothetical protein